MIGIYHRRFETVMNFLECNLHLLNGFSEPNFDTDLLWWWTSMCNEWSSPEYEDYLLVPKENPLVAQAANFALHRKLTWVKQRHSFDVKHWLVNENPYSFFARDKFSLWISQRSFSQQGSRWVYSKYWIFRGGSKASQQLFFLQVFSTNINRGVPFFHIIDI